MLSAERLSIERSRRRRAAAEMNPAAIGYNCRPKHCPNGEGLGILMTDPEVKAH